MAKLTSRILPVNKSEIGMIGEMKLFRITSNLVTRLLDTSGHVFEHF